MRWLAAAFLATVVLAQPAQESELLRAARSPFDLAKYAESHDQIDWELPWAAWKITDSDNLFPCGYRGTDACSTEILTLQKPDQAILILYGEFPKLDDLYLRYLKEADGSWRFAGQHHAHINATNLDRPHEIMRRWDKPFLVVANDQSQGGAAIIQEVEDWFDLTEPDFEPVFSFSRQGSYQPFGFAVGRKWESAAVLESLAPEEEIRLTVKVRFVGFSMDFSVTYEGVYQRGVDERKFSLKSAAGDGKPIPGADFEALGDASKMTNEQLLAYALPGLRKLAVSGDSEGKEWLKSVLESARDTPEKRELEALLAGKR